MEDCSRCDKSIDISKPHYVFRWKLQHETDMLTYTVNSGDYLFCTEECFDKWLDYAESHTDYPNG